MSKHRLSPAPLPATKRQHTSTDQIVLSTPLLNFDSSFYDELVLVIFSYLSWTDLCAIQSTNRFWSRLASDNQLWKTQFIREYGRSRLRGSRGFVNRHDSRAIRPLPHTHKSNPKCDDSNNVDWKWLFRISLNWRRGRCRLERFKDPLDLVPGSRTYLSGTAHGCALLAGSMTVTTSSLPGLSPHVYLHKHGAAPCILKNKLKEQSATHITALALDQSPPSASGDKLRVAAFYDTGEFSIFLVDHSQPQHSRCLLTYHPRNKTDRTAPVRQAAYQHPLLVTLSHSFKLSLYDLTDGVVHTQTLTSFSSYPPTSMVLTSGPKGYKLVLAYSAPVYPSDWSVAVTVLTISPANPDLAASDDREEEDSLRPFTVVTSKTVHAFDVPIGWLDEAALCVMKEQWSRRAARVADVQTDGKWVVLAPADRPLSPSPSSSPSSLRTRLGSTACALQLYRLHIPTYSSSANGLRLTFVRHLYGHTGPVISLALADGRCVSRGADGSLWVWDLERDWGVEVQRPRRAVSPPSEPSVSLSRSSSSPSSSVIVDGLSSESEDEDKFNIDWSENVPMGTPLGSVVFDERRIVTSDAYGVEVRRFDI
ncbi:hypothetical protein ACEPAH_6784 [Sanghuangporus vaninii]